MPDESHVRPPLPPLEWEHYTWAADVVRPEWAGFQSRRGRYNAVSSPEQSDGSVRLRVTVPNSEARTPPTVEQAAAYQYLLDHGSAVRDAVLAAVFAEYPQFREDYHDCFDDEDEEFAEIAAGVPELEEPEQLRSLMGLGNLFLLDESSGGVAYVGFEFGCEWESEHGLGVLTHRDRVIEIGQAPTAFDGHAARRDAAAAGGS